MAWNVYLHPKFEKDFAEFSESVQDEIVVLSDLLEEFGPLLSRPWADTLKGSFYANMKELRFKADNGVWRVAFAFDPEQSAILLIAGDKAGTNERRFYRSLIKKADGLYREHLESLKEKS
jgi:hypothetical protein